MRTPLVVLLVLAVIVVDLYGSVKRGQLNDVVRQLKLRHTEEVNLAFKAGREVGQFSMHAPIDDCDLYHTFKQKEDTKAANLRAAKLKSQETQK